MAEVGTIRPMEVEGECLRPSDRRVNCDQKVLKVLVLLGLVLIYNHTEISCACLERLSTFSSIQIYNVG